MKNQKFLIQIESSAETKWLVSPEIFRLIIEQVIQNQARFQTQGTVPAVTVTTEETQS